MQAAGEVPVQVVPSGPVFREGAIHALMMSIIYRAQRELIITTPYFAPDEALLEALVTAANRGVDVTLVIPARVDSLLIRYATPALLHGLIAVGIRVAQFDQGLLHTKSITVDGEFCVVGSVNTDMRSLWLNFEISLFVYDEGFTREIRELQASYISQSTFIDRNTLASARSGNGWSPTSCGCLHRCYERVSQPPAYVLTAHCRRRKSAHTRTNPARCYRSSDWLP